MTRIAPVKLPSSYKALWFDARDLAAQPGDAVVVTTARGTEFGKVEGDLFEATKQQLDSLKSGLKPVLRVATPEDIERAAELAQKGKDAMPDYRRIAEEEGLDMRPVSVEYLFDGDKAVFYFESEDRVDFRELVRKLSAHFKVRIDMRQIGVRDEARLVGGLGHCGQELCCKRLGGEFCPVSIRMAKEQDLSLNPQKISGICGRLMCCLRYEYDAYKDFKSRAPKVGGAVETPDGKGKVTQLDVPREVVTIQVADDKKIKVPLEDMTKTSEDAARPDKVDEEAWERATTREELSVFGDATFLTSQFTEKDKLGEAKAVHHESSSRPNAKNERDAERSSRSSRGRGSSRNASNSRAAEPEAPQHKRRRSTKLSEDGTTTVIETPAKGKETGSSQEKQEKRQSSRRSQQDRRQQSQQGSNKDQREKKEQRESQEQQEQKASSSSRSRRRRSRGSGNGSGAQSEGRTKAETQKQTGENAASEKQSIRPGHRSSALRQHGNAAQAEGRNASSAKPAAAAGEGTSEGNSSSRRRRRSRHRGGNGGNNGNNTGAQGTSSEKSE